MTTTESRETRLGQLFVRLADNLAEDFDIVDLLHDLVISCVDLFDVSAAGLMLVDGGDQLRVLAASSETTRLLELFELENQQGPCLECFRSGVPVVSTSTADQQSRWPVIAPQLKSRGSSRVYAFPLRLREQIIGVLDLFGSPGSALGAAEPPIVQSLADVATISLLQHQASEACARLATQLQTALTSRIPVEQAKGVIAQFASVDMDRAFTALRGYARRNQQSLTAVATDIAAGRLGPGTVTSSG
ncbi:GAF and ANTAR domain-containing protein [Microlunatus sp. Gsoil 973]|uniref:GAF and ANTAR domain-containing protein n=1 Tax=Microlunatus sp. Gsoil 973 TaxID=2672569 RepID=UPI0012B49C4C|nr:GAF and ANTAR domain-containing protein [Microlunatus sp. Gsoil 973]QGN33505.1 GAF domain-containing protein [Microlunatus sp. Gsoil 973]